MIIAFSGKRGTGKTLAANYLVANYGFKRVSFADALRKHATALMNFRPIDLAQWKERPYRSFDWTPRDFMIKLGGFMRYWHAGYWIEQLKIVAQNVAVDDLRFKNEAKYLKDKGAHIVRLNRYKKDLPYKEELDDPSETEMDDYEFDEIIHEFNNSTKDQLYSQLDAIMDEHGFKKIPNRSIT